MDLCKSTDPKAVLMKRVAIDAIYSIGIHCKDLIAHNKEDILQILDSCRTDKNQPVRSAAQETIKLLKEIPSIVSATKKAEPKSAFQAAQQKRDTATNRLATAKFGASSRAKPGLPDQQSNRDAGPGSSGRNFQARGAVIKEEEKQLDAPSDAEESSAKNGSRFGGRGKQNFLRRKEVDKSEPVKEALSAREKDPVKRLTRTSRLATVTATTQQPDRRNNFKDIFKKEEAQDTTELARVNEDLAEVATGKPPLRAAS